MRILLAVNANARRGAAPVDAALGVFQRAGMEVRHETVRKSRGIPALVRAHAAAVDAVVLGGGDGTVHSAARELLDAGRPVGILPLGTANDLARSLGLPLELDKAAEVIAAGETRRADVGEVNGELFFNVAHIGLGAALADALPRRLKKRFGPLGYTIAAAASLAQLRPFRATIVAGDEGLRFAGFAITVGNGRYFGGNGMVSEQAEIDDGLLHLFAVATKNPLKLAAMLPAFMSGRQGNWNDVRTLAATSIDISTSRRMRIRADGKMVGETPAAFRLHPGALTVFAPPPKA